MGDRKETVTIRFVPGKLLPALVTYMGIAGIGIPVATKLSTRVDMMLWPLWLTVLAVLLLVIKYG